MVAFSKSNSVRTPYAQPTGGASSGVHEPVDREIISVLGANCQLGHRIIEVSLRCGYQVQALTQSKLQHPADVDLRVLRSDGFLARDVQNVVRGSSCVINLCNVGNFVGSHDQLTSASITKIALAEMQRTRKTRYLLITHQSVSVPGDHRLGLHGLASRYLWPMMHRSRWRDMQDEVNALMQTQLAWTAVRCPQIKDVFGFGSISTDRHCPMGRFVALDRLARYLVHLKESNVYDQQAIFVASQSTRSSLASCTPKN
ncbi:hypothetical protein Poly59_21670 [Rubripirellula reticaptiva]|uniref:NAD(P)-binding domain-containing protein n=2 Tax=Rubripirellula reticaptiva TaxID=2528013 RepID=A0A5C6F5R2_9BACT|nr:hypothetical protein Poly59_21670 [Rubripirellula reticaptiva]